MKWPLQVKPPPGARWPTQSRSKKANFTFSVSASQVKCPLQVKPPTWGSEYRPPSWYVMVVSSIPSMLQSVPFIHQSHVCFQVTLPPPLPLGWTRKRKKRTERQVRNSDTTYYCSPLTQNNTVENTTKNGNTGCGQKIKVGLEQGSC